IIVTALIPVYLQRHGINGRQRESGIIQTIYNLPASDGLLIINGQVSQSRYGVLQNIVRSRLILQQQLDNATGASRAQQTQVKVVNVVVTQPQNIGEKLRNDS
ncbi:unnamed protein product, partial [Didymodactylos carnosus]